MTDNVAPSLSSFPRTGFFRRLAALVYDWLVCVALYMVAGLIYSAIFLALFQNGVIANQGYEHASDLLNNSFVAKSLMNIWGLSWCGLFLVWFWTHGGQTIGMRAWRLHLVDNAVKSSDASSLHAAPVSIKQAIIRLFTALGGLGNLLMLIDFKNKKALQDRLSNTEIVTLTKEANGKLYKSHKI
ncbi:RDD family protein [Flocculibacter collagenilyticus]|uniref:RDD family protein n=1 Tax=Flocculibacter collagenilyticus TaxID=2744479 RepID=UPI0018F61744|nr:RDD family protein [Flocculibacter collagenilyticus]